MGARPVTPFRTRDFLNNLTKTDLFHFYTASGKMGEDILKDQGLEYTVIGQIRINTSGEDTKKIIGLMVKEKMDLIVFVGEMVQQGMYMIH